MVISLTKVRGSRPPHLGRAGGPRRLPAGARERAGGAGGRHRRGLPAADGPAPGRGGRPPDGPRGLPRGGPGELEPAGAIYREISARLTDNFGSNRL